MSKAKKRKAKKGISWPVMIALLLLVLLVLGWRGYDYYPLSLDDRVDHTDYRTLRSSGDVGYGYGVVGTILIFTNLLYLARRRFARLKVGSLKTWLDLHVFTGLAGALFISFHSTFKARNTISQVTSYSLLLVVITGLVGRFLYALVPRKDEKGARESLKAIGEISPSLKESISSGLKSMAPAPASKVSLWKLPSYWMSLRKTERGQIELVELSVANDPVYQTRERDLDRLSARLKKSISVNIRSFRASAVLRSWRSMHMFFAILMILTVVFHIGIAWHYGYRWIWSE